uniref:Uncharacterized protein n=1 Tax=Rhizophora mucronata TaxID=61149 RepID=A0A2P2JYZ4_RHIMU
MDTCLPEVTAKTAPALTTDFTCKNMTVEQCYASLELIISISHQPKPTTSEKILASLSNTTRYQ